MTKTLEKVWINCLSIIKDNVPLQAFKTWFEPIKPIKLKGNVLTIQVPSQFFYEWLRRTLHRTTKENNSQRNWPGCKVGIQYCNGK